MPNIFVLIDQVLTRTIRFLDTALIYGSQRITPLWEAGRRGKLFIIGSACISAVVILGLGLAVRGPSKPLSIGGIHIPTATPLALQTVVPAPIIDHYELSEQDNGKSFSYSVTSRFSVVLDGSRFPPHATRCTPDDVLGTITNLPSVAPPLAASRFEGVRPGQCDLRNGDWVTTIVITAGH